MGRSDAWREQVRHVRAPLGGALEILFPEIYLSDNIKVDGVQLISHVISHFLALFGCPGISYLQFGWGDDDKHLPHLLKRTGFLLQHPHVAIASHP